MDSLQILDELMRLLEAHGVTIRMEFLDESQGGLCRVGEKQVLFLDRCSRENTLAALCAKALATVADIESMYLRPEVRAFVEEQLAKGKEDTDSPFSATFH